MSNIYMPIDKCSIPFVLPTLSQNCHSSECDNLGVWQVNPLPVGVYQQFEIVVPVLGYCHIGYALSGDRFITGLHLSDAFSSETTCHRREPLQNIYWEHFLLKIQHFRTTEMYGGNSMGCLVLGEDGEGNMVAGVNHTDNPLLLSASDHFIWCHPNTPLTCSIVLSKFVPTPPSCQGYTHYWGWLHTSLTRLSIS